MIRLRPGFLAIALAVAPVLVSLPGCGGKATYPSSMQHHLLNQPLPTLHARETLNAGALDSTELAGKVVVVKFFAEYCAPCKATLPATERVHKSHGDVAFVGVSLDESRAAAARLVDAFGISFPVVYDASRVFQGKFRVNEMPRTFVADKQGIVRWVGGEGQTEDDLTQAVEAAR
jgi:thiol-disulfide isomerase/thioredoxin